MAWARVDDGWWSHPKVLGLSLESRGLWITALSWSCAQRKSRVPHHLARMVGATEDQTAELVDAGLWRETEGGWEIHDWAEYQDLSLSEKRARAGRKGAEKRWQTDSNDIANIAPDQGEQDDPEDGKSIANDLAIDGKRHGRYPSRPVPSLPNPSTTPPTPPRLAERWARSWCEVRGINATRAVLRSLVPRVAEYIEDAGEPTEALLKRAHEMGIKNPGGWGYAAAREAGTMTDDEWRAIAGGE